MCRIQLLVVYYERQQYQQRMERQFQQWQREQQQFACSRSASMLVIGPDIYSFSALWRCYRQCRRNKRNTANALAFEMNAEANLLALSKELREHTYRPGRSICFITDGPKPREVFAADFRDRVVHHLLVSHQERIFEPRFIHDSYACRKGKGSLAASNRLMVFLRKITANGRRPAWALKLDVANFFPSIHKETLFEIISHNVTHPELLWLTRTLLFHDPTTNYRFKSLRKDVGAPGTPGYPVPLHKSLFGKLNERGLPIGNLTSQFWGNVYLNELDHFIKRTLKCKDYLRYVDDMILLAQDRELLVEWVRAIACYLKENLKLNLRSEMAKPFSVGNGIDFVGWKTWWNRRLPRRRTLGDLKKRLDAFQHLAVQPAWRGKARRIDLNRHDRNGSVKILNSVLASYAGHLQHGLALRQWEETWKRYEWLSALYECHGWIVEERWRTRRILRSRSFNSQYWKLIRNANSDCLIFCQVGDFIEFYGLQRFLAIKTLGLRSAALPRGRYEFRAGFPVYLSHIYRARALRRGFNVVDVRQVTLALNRRPMPRIPYSLTIPT
jgi:RNA-directed DNA polymerase